MTSDYPPVAKFESTDDGILISLTDEWWEMSKDQYLDFDSYKHYYRRDDEAEILVNYDKSTGLEGLYANPPDSLLEDDESSFIYKSYTSAATTLVSNNALSQMIGVEMEEIERLTKSGDYKMAILRESAFFEELLVLLSIEELRRNKLDSLSNKDLSLVEQMGHSDRIRLARLLRVLDEQQHQRLQEMASRRNMIAHTPWSEFNEDDEETNQRVATKSLDVLKQLHSNMNTSIDYGG